MLFQKELEFFISHQEELVKKYKGKILAIKAQEIIGIYSTPLEAYLETQKKYPAGTFMLQPCEPGVEAYTVTIN